MIHISRLSFLHQFALRTREIAVRRLSRGPCHTRFSRGRINNAKEDLIILTHDHRSSLVIFHRAADLATISCELCRTFRIPLEFRTRPGECYQITRRSSNVTIASLRSWPSPPPPLFLSLSFSCFFSVFLRLSFFLIKFSIDLAPCDGITAVSSYIRAWPVRLGCAKWINKSLNRRLT